MRKTYLNPAHMREDIQDGCTELMLVDLTENEAGGRRTAVVGKTPEGLWKCLAVDGKKAEGRGYKTIRAAVKNAVTE